MPRQVLLDGSKEKKTSCSSHFPETDSNLFGGVTCNRTGDPFTTRFGCQRTDQEPTALPLADPALASAPVTDSKINTNRGIQVPRRKGVRPEPGSTFIEFLLQLLFSRLSSPGNSRVSLLIVAIRLHPAALSQRHRHFQGSG